MVLDSKIITLYSDVRMETIQWVWYPYIPLGKITLLQGDPGDGKSTMIMHIIAEISKGGKLPDGTELERPRRVIYQCSEDGTKDTIKPRLEKCGADCSNIWSVFLQAFFQSLDPLHNPVSIANLSVRSI